MTANNVFIPEEPGYLFTLARKYSLYNPVLYDDLVQEGRMAILRAKAGFSSSRGHWSTYSYIVIERAMIRYTRNQSSTIRSVMCIPIESVSPSSQSLSIEDNLDSDVVIEQLFRVLSPIERFVIVSRYGIGGCKKHLLRDIGAVIGVSGERVRQIQSVAEKKLRREAAYHAQ